MKYKNLIIGLLSVSFLGLANAQQTSVKEKSILLDTRMSETRVKNLIGNPESVEMQTCGGSSKENAPWSCKIYTYKDSCCGYSPPELSVYFFQMGNQWYVNSWRIWGK